MDTKDLKGLMEAYSEVYAPQEVDEAITSEKGKAKAAEMIAARSTPSGRAKSGQGANVAQIKHIGRANVDGYGGTPPNRKVAKNPVKSNFTGLNTGTGNKAARRVAALKKEDFDIFDVVLEFLQAEGYAETLEEAEWLMANELDAEDIEAILEAEGSYGQTPKARQAMGKLAIARREKPASEYSQKGEKTKKVKEIEKHTRRIDNGPDVGNRGKKSTKPRWSGYLGVKGRGKMDQDSRDYARDRDVEYTAGGNKPGPGGVTKNPKKLRKQKAMGEHD